MNSVRGAASHDAGRIPDRRTPDRRAPGRNAPGSAARVPALLRAAHLGPALAVTVLAGALAFSAGMAGGRIALVTAAVLAGQLSIGWSNDLIDRVRDEQVGRADKPLATGELAWKTAATACLLAIAATIVFSLLCGIVAGLIHLGCVAAGWAYNLGMKATALSWLPYAVAFGGLTVFVVLAEPGAGFPPLWLPVAGALLGVGAHLVNVLPDLADDQATGVRGLPHRIGPKWIPVVAVVALASASVVIAIGANSLSTAGLVVALLAVAALSAVALFARGRAPFQAAIGIALVDVVMLMMA
jgi:4-hydroxybenzoate polyprenyltransferase